MKKAQIFTLDAFLSLLLVTVAIGLLVTQTEAIISENSFDTKTLASDLAQIAVKNTLVYNEPNNLTTSKLSDLKTLLDSTFQNTPYSYEVEVYNGTETIIQGNPSCSSSTQVSIIQKPAIVDNEEGYLKMKICVIQ